MKVTHVVALVAALLLTATEFLVMDYDARQRAVHYRAETTDAARARSHPLQLVPTGSTQPFTLRSNE